MKPVSDNKNIPKGGNVRRKRLLLKVFTEKERHITGNKKTKKETKKRKSTLRRLLKKQKDKCEGESFQVSDLF